MKRIIDGTTYDPETSTLVAAEFGADMLRWDRALYQTLGGACFFEVHDDGDTIVPVTRDEATAWIEDKRSVAGKRMHIFGPDGPMWSIEETLEALRSGHADAAYFRMPSLLKQQIESAAKQAGMSLNSWALRAFECALREKAL